jgi:hypothetical protein
MNSRICYLKPIKNTETNGSKFQSCSSEGTPDKYFRTDNSIKNHFYSTIRRSLRRICKLLGNKNSTSQLRSIKPSILS